jgi:small subunit ribosomal protein S9
VAEKVIRATGRRKRGVARVQIKSGNDPIKVNQREVMAYFNNPRLRDEIEKPLKVTEKLGLFSVTALCRGGGLTGQADAIKLGIARALVKLDPALRTALRKAGLLTRDSREVERKKYGRSGARKRFQFSKR